MKLVHQKCNRYCSGKFLFLVIILPVFISVTSGGKRSLESPYDKLSYSFDGSDFLDNDITVNRGETGYLLYKPRIERSVSTPTPIFVNTTAVAVKTESNDTTTTTTTTRPSVAEVKNSTNTVIKSNSSETDNSLYNMESESDELPVDYNETKKFDHHKYYKSYYKVGLENVHQYWVDMGSLPKEKKMIHESLSNAYRRALTVTLKFDFPFYGHNLRNVTIATGGFLFTGAFLHKWLAATQYIAPLMANFDTSFSPDAHVIYHDNGTSLTVQWDKVVLQDDPHAGTFTFQVTIHQSGLIVFAYKDIPVTVTLIQDMEHPVKVGLSDAYIVEKKIFYVRKKTIYEYHKIDIKDGMQIGNWTAIVFEPLPLCISITTCEECLTMETSFQCRWCPQVNRCSDGYDRHRQDWIEWHCEDSAVSNISICGQLPSFKNYPSSGNNPPVGASTDSLVTEGAKSGHSNLWVGLLMALVVVAFLCGWVTYAYLHPHTPSGQILIKYRPSAWSLRRGEARYTAATMHSIHM